MNGEVHVEEEHSREGREVEVELHPVDELLQLHDVGLGRIHPEERSDEVVDRDGLQVRQVFHDDEVRLLGEQALQAGAMRKRREARPRDAVVDQDVVGVREGRVDDVHEVVEPAEALLAWGAGGADVVDQRQCINVLRQVRPAGGWGTCEQWHGGVAFAVATHLFPLWPGLTPQTQNSARRGGQLVAASSCMPAPLSCIPDQLPTAPIDKEGR